MCSLACTFIRNGHSPNGSATTTSKISLSSHICFTSSDVFLCYPIHKSKPNQPCCFKSMWYGGKERTKCAHQPTHHQYGVCDIVTGTSVDQNKFRVRGSKRIVLLCQSQLHVQSSSIGYLYMFKLHCRSIIRDVVENWHKLFLYPFISL